MTYPTQRRKSMEILNELNVAIKGLKPEQVNRITKAFKHNFGKLTTEDKVIYDYTPEWEVMNKLRNICMKWFTAYSDDTGFPVAQRAFEYVKSVAYANDDESLELRNSDDLIFYKITGDSRPRQTLNSFNYV